jgi:hypothetical protein
MSSKSLVFPFLVLVAMCCHASASDSLYDRKSAQKLDAGKLWFFGPLASRYRYDSRMVHAAEIAAARAHRHSTSRCWRYVKDALLASKIITTRPKTEYAKEAAGELTRSYGFRAIKEKNPYKAPLGSVLVYGGRGAGHVEIRTAQGFVSDFVSAKPSHRPLIGIFVKPRA